MSVCVAQAVGSSHPQTGSGVIGGLVAVGLAAKGPDSLGWGKLGTIHLLDSS